MRCGSKFIVGKPLIVSYLKTDAAYRDIDLHPEVAEYLRVFICGKDGLLFKTRNGTPHVGLQNASKPCSLTNRGWAGMPLAVSGIHGCEGGDARRTSRISGWATNLGPCPSCIRTCSRRWSFDLRKARKWAHWASLASSTPVCPPSVHWLCTERGASVNDMN